MIKRAFVAAGLAFLVLPGEVALHWNLWAIAGMSVLAGLVAGMVMNHD